MPAAPAQVAKLSARIVLMDSPKARHPLDELLGVDPRTLEEDELTQVISRSDPPPAPRVEASGPIGVSSEPHITIGTPVTSDVDFDADYIPESEDRPTVPGDEPPTAAGPVSPVALAGPHDEARDPLIGTVLDGRYRVQSILGIGGIGIVYLCQHEQFGRPVALKMLRPEYVSHKDLNERFMIEARAASSIKSPRIVDTIDVGTLPNGAPYFVMEYVEGETLASLLERDGSVDLPRTLEIARQVAEGLCAAHAAGVVHRDLKPENVFLAAQPDGALFAKLFDFGIAKVAGVRKRLTYVGAVFGTPTYMSPEQARGEAVDERADLYALGIMIFEMLAARVPFDGDDPLAIMSQHVDRPAPPLSSASLVPVPALLEAIVQRCLEKEPAARYPNAASLLEHLNAVDPNAPAVEPARTPRPVSVQTLTTHVVSTPPAPRRAGPMLGFGLAAALAGAAGGYGLWKSFHPTDTALSSKVALAERSTESALPARPAAARNATSSGEQTEVHFVLFPLDARVFRGDQDLGQMPVSLHVTKGRPVTVTVRRKGFSTRKVVVDGSESRVVVGLVKSPPEGSSATRSSPVKRSPTRAATPNARATER